ncbi:MAG: universal stress protein [Gammaproteobacteria bacterium]|nr:universal stress protein [Gammaproteobacteria bacterium]MCP4980225.1 universal stress protein [Gammaproteobacteria bacterium]
MHNNILFPVDLEHTAEAEKALKIAIGEAQRSAAKMTVMTVAPGFGTPLVASFFDEETVRNALKEVARHLKQYIADNVPDDIEVNAVVAEGNPAELILKQAQDDDIDLIVIASHNSQIENLLLGSCAAKVVRHSHCSVTVVK